ncbi:MAG: hypothetical protein PVH19_00085 [Planctomycetia bacterium]|jgi:hypothetical protein
MDTVEAFAKYAPQYLPLLGAIMVILFTRNYVYKGMVPEKLINDQVEREKTILKEQSEREQQRLKEQAQRDLNLAEIAKDLEQHLEEVVYQLQSLMKKVSDEIGESHARISSLEAHISQQMDVIRDQSKTLQQLTFQIEKARKGIPDTQIHRKERHP